MILFYCRNGIRPMKGIDTLKFPLGREIFEGRNGIRPMKGIDTFLTAIIILPPPERRNGIRPMKGIDTVKAAVVTQVFLVEMGFAR